MPDGPKILIVEDDKFLSQILKGRLEREGFQISQAFDGEEGLNLMKKDIPSLVLLDLIMPKMSGFEMLERFSLDPQLRDIPVVVVSNLGQETDIQKAKSLGVTDYYVKVQMSIDELVGTLKNLVQK